MDQNGPNLAPPSFHATRISIFLENCSSQTTCVCLREERDILRSKRHAASPSSVTLFDGWIFVKKAHVITVVSPDKYVQSFCLACDRFGDGDVCHSKKEICSFYALYIIGGNMDNVKPNKRMEPGVHTCAICDVETLCWDLQRIIFLRFIFIQLYLKRLSSKSCNRN